MGLHPNQVEGVEVIITIQADHDQGHQCDHPPGGQDQGPREGRPRGQGVGIGTGIIMMNVTVGKDHHPLIGITGGTNHTITSLGGHKDIIRLPLVGVIDGTLEATRTSLCHEFITVWINIFCISIVWILFTMLINVQLITSMIEFDLICLQEKNEDCIHFFTLPLFLSFSLSFLLPLNYYSNLTQKKIQIN